MTADPKDGELVAPLPPLPQLPANLPSIAEARLPTVYENAKQAISECWRVDECQDWADKMAAMASYARQAEDQTLYRTVVKIQARAISRCGDLLRSIQSAQGKRSDLKLPEGDHRKSRRQAGREAGLSDHQIETALRVSNIPKDEFEALVESDDPPTVTQLAERGTAKKAPRTDHLKGRDPQEFNLAIQAHGAVERMAQMTQRVSPTIAVRGETVESRKADLRRWAEISIAWLSELIAELEK